MRPPDGASQIEARPAEGRQRNLRLSSGFRTLHAWRNGVRPVWRLFALVAIGMSSSAEAHDVLGTYVQHGVHLTIGMDHVDVTLDLTFFEEWSTRERRTMDADASGKITRTELNSYVTKFAPQLAQQVKLRVAGREVPLVPLYDPEVDLLANDTVGPAHHRLRLFFFAPTPMLQEKDEIVIEDHLWPEAKALATSAAEGRDGCTLTAEDSAHAGSAPLRPDGAHVFKFRCLGAPVKKSATQRTSLSGSPASSARCSDAGQVPKQSTTASIP